MERTGQSEGIRRVGSAIEQSVSVKTTLPAKVGAVPHQMRRFYFRLKSRADSASATNSEMSIPTALAKR